MEFLKHSYHTAAGDPSIVVSILPVPSFPEYTMYVKDPEGENEPASMPLD